jgi:hypothetical protein
MIAGCFYQDGIDKYDGSSTPQIEDTTGKKVYSLLYSSLPRYSASRETSCLISLADF